MINLDKVLKTGTITENELKEATAEQLTALLTTLPSIIEHCGADDEILELVKKEAIHRMDKKVFLSYDDVVSIVDNIESISVEAKDAVKKSLLIVSVFNAHEKLYTQQKKKQLEG